MEDRAADEKLDFKRILPIFVIVLVDILGLTIIIPLMPLYAVSFGASAVTIGLLGTAYPVTQFVGAPVMGRLSDRYGRKPVLLVSQLGTLAGFLVLGFANTLALLFAARIIDGLSGANISTAQAAITDNTTEKTRTQGLGLIGAAFGLGFIVGPLIAFASLALSGNDYHVPAFVAAGFSALSVLLTAFWFQETHPAGQSDGTARKGALSPGAMVAALRHPVVGLLLVLMFAQQIAFGGFEFLLPLFTLNRLGMNASDNAALFVFAGLILVVVQGYFVGRWSRSLGDRRLVYLGLLMLAVGLVVIAFAPRQAVPWYSRAALEEELASQSAGARLANLPVSLPDEGSTGWLGLGWVLATMVPLAIGGGILQPSINSLITRRVNPDDVGGTLGLSASFLSAANAVAPLLGGAVFQALGASAPFLGGGALLVVLLLVALQGITPQVEESAAAGQPV